MANELTDPLHLSAVDRPYFDLLFAWNPLPMWIYDVQTLAFLEVNRAAVLFYGYSRDEFLRMGLTDIRPAEDIERLRADLQNRAPAPLHSREWRHRLRDGRLVDVEITSSALEFEGRQAAVVVIHNVTEQKRIEREIRILNVELEQRVVDRTEELAAARREADRANHAKSDFLSLMSHDLRTPLNAILGFAQLLEMDDLTPEQAESVHQILSGGRHLLDLISEVLDITRIESGQLSLSPERVSVEDVVNRAVELIQPLAAQRGIVLTVQPFAASDTVHADRQRLSQILLNLLSNAVKYNRLNGRVTVGGERTPSGRYRITVTDTGAGIPEAKVNFLFQPFERLGAEQTGVEGTGLGLALSRSLAEAMGGSLGVTSVVDRGSTFWVDLARSESPSDRPATRSAEAVASQPAQRGLILYIEDNLSNVRLMKQILRQRPGVELLHAPDGETGIALLQARRPDVVLTDLHLPDMSGEDLLQRLWADPLSRAIPIVVVTADATPGLGRRLKASGAATYLTKPLDVKKVLQVVDTFLNESQREKL